MSTAATTGERLNQVLRALLCALAVTSATPFFVNVAGHVTLRSPDVLVAGACLALALMPRRLFADIRALFAHRPLVAWSFSLLVLVLLVGCGIAEDRMLWLKAIKPWLLLGAGLFAVWSSRPDDAFARRLLGLAWLSLAFQATLGWWQLHVGEEGMRRLFVSPLGRLLYEPDVVASLLPTFGFNWSMAPDDPMRDLGLTAYPSGTSINSTTFSLHMALLAGASVVVPPPTSRRGARVVFMTFGALAAVLAILSFKRTGWLALAAGIAAAGALARRLDGRALLLLCIVAVVLFAGIRSISVPAAASLSGRGASIAREVEHDAVHANSRRALWMRAAELAFEKPLTGVGPGQWEFHGPWTNTRNGLLRWSNPESSFARLLAETGLPGILAFLGFLAGLGLAAVRATRRRAPLAPFLVMSLAALFAGGAMNDLLTGDAVWPLVACVGGILLCLPESAASTVVDPERQAAIATS